MRRLRRLSPPEQCLLLALRSLCTTVEQSVHATAGQSVQPSALRRRTLRPLPLPPPQDFAGVSRSPSFSFELLHVSSRSGARVGRITTPHGVVDTPGFVAVGTNGALKHVDGADADAAGMQLMFCNTYHLLLAGVEPIEAAGGLHAFIGRPRSPLITDSGGFQIFSLQHGGVTAELAAGGELKRAAVRGTEPEGGAVLKVNEQGVLFRSYRDGARVLLTPESSIAAQKALGADIILPLDHLCGYHISPEALSDATARSHRWMARSLQAHIGDPRRQAMYGIVHGGTDTGLRAESAAYLGALPFDGLAIGGALGRDLPEMHGMLQALMPRLPPALPRHLLGVGDEASLRACVPLGIDTFDSAFPTRLGRHGTLLTRAGRLHLRKKEHALAHSQPVEEGCPCAACTRYSRAYLHHLWRAREPLAMQLAALHNLAHTLRLTAGLRADILADRV